jgi:hypothetical protein
MTLWIIGLDNKTLLVETAGNPANVRDEFHTDKIQQIVTRHAYEAFEIEVAFAERDGIEIPVVVIPSGVQYPVASKADVFAADGKKLLVRAGDVYCRTLNSNGSASSAVASPKDWRDIFDRCFENREADIGRFLRRHLGSADLSFGATSKSPTLREQMAGFLDEGMARFQQAAGRRILSGPQLEVVNGAKFEVGLVVDPSKSDQLSTQTFLQLLSTNNPRLTGWPIWMDSSSFVEEHTRPDRS